MDVAFYYQEYIDRGWLPKHITSKSLFYIKIVICIREIFSYCSVIKNMTCFIISRW